MTSKASKFEKSMEFYGRSEAIPGRSSTRSKAPGKMFPVGMGPMYAASAAGAVITDVDGNEYIDMLCALGAISLGYGMHGEVLSHGSYSLPHVAEPLCAEAILEHVAPWASRVRFTRTGSEATHAAYRIAKRATGRKKVLIGKDSYHGWAEWCERKLDGTPENEWARLYLHNEEIGEFDEGSPDEVAAVFVEPHRWKPIDVNWLIALRAWCDQHGVVLVFDEMIYGGRWAIGGATQVFGVTPDMACFGKALGNGAPFACVVGNDVVRDYGEIVSGTFSGDAGALIQAAAVVASYEQKEVVATMWSRGAQLKVGLVSAVEATGWSGSAFPEGSDVHQRLRFALPELGRQFSALMAARGIVWHPDVVNLCASHTPQQIATVADAAADALRIMGKP